MRFWIMPVGKFSADQTVLDPHASPGNLLNIPVYAYLIESSNGLILYDTGCSDTCRTHPVRLLGEEFSAVLKPMLMTEDMIVPQLNRIGFTSSDIDLVVNSHLHFDHAGGNRLFDRNAFILQEAEWQAAQTDHEQYPDVDAVSINPTMLQLINGDHQLAPGVHLISTPGHTSGHQSLWVELDQGPLLVTSDAVYTREQFDPERVGSSVDVDQARISVARLLDLQKTTGARTFFSHDPQQVQQESWQLSPLFYK